MGDGYRLKEQKAFARAAAQIPTLFKRHDLFGSYFPDHNFHAVHLVSKDSSVDSNGREFDTALDGQEGPALQGQVTVDKGLVRTFAKYVPEQEDLTIVFVQRGSLGTGGPGVATLGGKSADTVYHEWGHAFGLLSDEYAGTTKTREGKPNHANLAWTDDPELVPWAHWIEARVRGIGVYEGAHGQVQGAWKPSNHCAMAKGAEFCPVCREATVLEIYRRVDPIDGCTPEAHGLDSAETIAVSKATSFHVEVLEPIGHGLKAVWWVLAEGDVPEGPRAVESGFANSDRRARGPLLPIETKPVLEKKCPKRGVHSFTLDPEELSPGRYRVVCRVTDPVKGRGDRHPWVLRDLHGLLQSERAWWIRID
jgi:hypothetical protein